MYDHLNIYPSSKTHFKSLYKQWREIREQGRFQRNSNENGYDREQRLALIHEWENAYNSWHNSIDYESLTDK